MRRRLALVAAAIVIVGASGLWIQARVTERCPDVGVATSIDVSVTARESWRFVELTVAGRSYSLEPRVMADFGAYVRPFPVPQSHHVGASLTVQASDIDTVTAWKATCLRLVHGHDAVGRPAVAGRDITASGGAPTFYYRFDGANGYPEWPPGDMVEAEVTFLVDGAPFLIRFLAVPIVAVG